MALLTWKMQAKTTTILNAVMFVLRVLGWLRLIDVETAAKVVRFISRKGLAAKYRIGNGKWTKVNFDFDYEIEEEN